jgi:hypothetical protein
MFRPPPAKQKPTPPKNLTFPQKKREKMKVERGTPEFFPLVRRVARPLQPRENRKTTGRSIECNKKGVKDSWN